jgi:hypothetical protein
MDFALPTVLFLLALAPGVVLWHSYLSSRFPRQTFAASPAVEISAYFVLALAVDGTCFLLLRRQIGGTEMRDLLVLAGGGRAADAAANGGRSAAWGTLFGIYLAMIVASFFCGSLLRRLVWALRLDIVVPVCRMKHDWYYILQGRLRGVPRGVVPRADVLVTHPEQGTRLYSGRVVSFQLTPEGQIRELLLADAVRGKDRSSKFRWVGVPGDRLVLFGPSIHSINMTYWDLSPRHPSRWARWRWNAGQWARALLLEEP